MYTLLIGKVQITYKSCMCNVQVGYISIEDNEHLLKDIKKQHRKCKKHNTKILSIKRVVCDSQTFTWECI